jgi:predicted transposase YbfD/YdcC
VPEKTNEITAIPELLDHLAEAEQLEGAPVTIDAMGRQVAIADKIVEHKADDLLALNGNQPTLEAEVADYCNSAPRKNSSSRTRKLKRDTAASRCGPTPASSNVDWIVSTKSYPGKPRFTNIKTLVKVFSRVE